MKNLIILILIVSSLVFLKFVIPKVNNEEDEKDDEALVNVKTPDGTLITCGVERWAVKTLIDPDTTHINFNNVIPSTIQYQRSLTKPVTLPDTRLDVEDTVYSIECIMYKYKLEDDNDIHIVIHAVGDTSQTMVAEMLNAQCPGVAATSRYTQLNNLRTWFNNTYHPTTSFTTANVRIRISGVGFFDFLHGQTGIPPNGREIHPILTFVLVSNINSISNEVPSDYKLFQNYPNPFNPGTMIRFQITKSENGKGKIENGLIMLKVYDILGKEVSTLVNERLQPGTYEVPFSNKQLSSGIYLYKLEAGNFTDTKQMLLVK